jgi:uncharacterized protein (DUF433 family)
MFWEVLMRFTRITVDPLQMGGLPCIRGLRIPVATIVSMVAEGMTEAEILEAYPDLTLEDIQEVMRYAAEAPRDEVIFERAAQAVSEHSLFLTVSGECG